MDVKVLIFDDNLDRLDSLKMLIESTTGIQFVGALEQATDAVEVVSKLLPDVILMDIGLPGVSGIEATRNIKKQFPEMQIIIQTVFDDDERIFESLKAGASGYLLKSCNASKIIDAIIDANGGGSPITPSIAFRMVDYFRSQPILNNPDYGLSDREKEVLTHLVQGLSYKMIATEMYISYNTVNSHVKKVYEKLHVHSVGEAISKAIQQKII